MRALDKFGPNEQRLCAEPGIEENIAGQIHGNGAVSDTGSTDEDEIILNPEDGHEDVEVDPNPEAGHEVIGVANVAVDPNGQA